MGCSKTVIDQTPKIPFVIMKLRYFIFWPRNMHPFDAKKYSAVFNYVSKALGFSQARCYKPEIVTQEALLKVHSQEYLDSLKTSATVARITELVYCHGT